MLDPRQIAERYIATWNETNERKRSELLQADWNGDASYVDPIAKAVGHEDIGGLIGGVLGARDRDVLSCGRADDEPSATARAGLTHGAEHARITSDAIDATARSGIIHIVGPTALCRLSLRLDGRAHGLRRICPLFLGVGPQLALGAPLVKT
jgi:hypothetical protein